MSPLINLEGFVQASALPGLPSAVKAWFAGNGFLKLVLALDEDSKLRAKHFVNLLQHAALSPSYGNTLDSFVFNAAGKTTFMVNLHSLSNFLGTAATLDEGSDEHRALTEAIEANLASKMFRAASLTRRMSVGQRRGKFSAHVVPRARARVAQQEAERLAADPEAKPLSTGSFNCHVSSLVERYVTEHVSRGWARIHQLERLTHGELFNGSYYDNMLAFTLRYLLPDDLKAVIEASVAT